MGRPGICWLCGRETSKLTADHIQPKCAFNEKKRKHVRLNSVTNLSIRPNAALSGPTVRNIYREIQPDRPVAGGIYYYRQCWDCNNRLSRLYDAQFGRWCHDAPANLKPGEEALVRRKYRQRCRYPLSILKRVAATFFSINGGQFARHRPEFSRFARFPHSHELPENVRFYAAYNINDLVSHIPVQARRNVLTGAQGLYSQVAHPPFVYLLSLSGECPDARLTDLSPFAAYDYDDEANIEMTFRVLPTNSCFAGDYRAAGRLLPDGVIVLTPTIDPSFYRLVDLIV